MLKTTCSCVTKRGKGSPAGSSPVPGWCLYASLLGLSKMRGLIIIGVVLVAVSAMRHGSYRPLPTAPMPVVNVP
jgi:hypothetical protein